MKTFYSSLVAVLLTFASPGLNAAVSVATSAPTFGTIFTSTGAVVATGGESVGFFTSAVADGAFGTTINSWADLLAAGWKDVRTLPGVSLSGSFDWDFPTPIGGTVSNIQLADLPTGTQLYVAAFNAGTFLGNNASSFAGATEWAFIKDGLSPADLGTRSITINSASNVALIGTDTGSNVNMAPLSAGPVPEPSRLILLGLGGMGLLFRRRRC
jgi:PEP-CTERM motif